MDGRTREEKNRRVPPHERAAARAEGAAPATDDVAEATRLAKEADKAREKQERAEARSAASAKHCSSCGADLVAGKLRPGREGDDDPEGAAATGTPAETQRTFLDELAE